MADTMSFALLGVAAVLADAAAGAVRLSSCASRSRSRRCRSTSASQRAYDRLLHVCLRHPRGDGRASASLLFGASLLLVPFIGAEFMPHLDEGALWVRATMPYTISFDEASKLGPQVRRHAARLPAGHDRRQRARPPDDEGTDPIGFFNDEYFVGLKPYDDPAWTRIDQHEGAADRRDPGEARRVPRHHLQLHAAGRGRGGRGRDRAEELAGREDLRRRSRRRSSRRPKRCATVLAAVPGITGHHAGARARAAEPDHRAGPREDRAVRPERRGHQHADRDGGRRQRRRRR